jgi:uncharacterized membrane protein
MNPTDNRISLAVAQPRLAVIWFSGGGLILLLVILQSLMGKYEGRTDEAWSWLLPTIMPTLSLIVGALVAGAKRENQPEETVTRFVFSLSFWLSLAYLLLVALTIFVSPFAAENVKESLELMHRSNLWLGPLQGLVGAALGVFFTSKK